MRRPGLLLVCTALAWPLAAQTAAPTECAALPRDSDDYRRCRERTRSQSDRTQADKDDDEFRLPRPRVEDYPPAEALPDRWRIVETLGYTERWYDPYNRNVLKGDRPVHDDWFFSLTVVSDTIFEDRDVVTPVGQQSTGRSGKLDLLGNTEQSALVQNLLFEFVYYKGDTVFKPPDYEFRFIPVINYNVTEAEEVLLLNVDPAEGDTRYDSHVGIQGAFVDVHLRNVSERYDFDSVRFGIQPYNHDFRGFVFQDNQFGLRLFGTRDNNRFQYNLAWFRRLEKDTNSGLNDLGESLRDDDVFVANLYWQDALVLGHFLQFSLLYNRNREDEFFYDTNGFIQRPFSFGSERFREYDAYYLGFNTDGHLGRLNLTTSLYYLWGEQEGSPFIDDKADIEAGFAAAELSIDTDWIRWRASLLWASGDEDPFDDTENGFDAVFENPQFAGADTSYWIRQSVPLVGGGKVALSTRNGVLNSLRASKEHGQSNFTNPGIRLLGLGADLDLMPELRLSFNFNQLWFDRTEVLEVARLQADIDSSIGRDLSVAAIYRPLMSQNIVLRLSYAVLQPDDGFETLFGDDTQRSVLLNAIFTY
jgi:hypothetical protein